jgi:hypothetical protein
MTAVSRLGRQISEVTAVLRGNDPRRTQDREDIRALLRANRACEKSTDAPLVAEGGVRVQPERPADPYRELDDLMAVVEQLCPRWPERDVFRHESQNIL